MSRKNKSNFGALPPGMLLPPKPFMSLGRVKAPQVSASSMAAKIAAITAQQTEAKTASPLASIAKAVSVTPVARKVPAKPTGGVFDVINANKGDALVTAASPAAQAAASLVDKGGPLVTPDNAAVQAATSLVDVPSKMGPAAYVPPVQSGGGGGGGGGASEDKAYQPESQDTAYQPEQAASQPQETEAWSPPVAARSTSMAMVPASSVPVLSTATSSPTVSKGIFARIWEFFFGGSSQPAKALPAAPVAAPPKLNGEIDDAAESLVKRARYGDQNAMAIIDLVGKNAKKGVPAAVKARALIAAYIQRNPVVGAEVETTVPMLASSHNGMHGEASVKRAATHIADGAKVTHASIMGALSRFSTEPEKGAFLHGVKHPAQITPSEYGSKIELAHRAGRAMALAGKIQNVRRPGSRITAFDPVVGWELGE